MVVFPLLLILNLLFWSGLLNNNKSHENVNKFCKDSTNKNVCTSETFAYIAKNNPLDKTLDILSNYRAQNSSQVGCHLIAHKISFEEVSKNPKNWLSIFSKVTSGECTGGFLMGAMEAKKYYDKKFVLSQKTIASACDEISRINEGEGKLTCYHITGHLLLVESGGDVNKTLAKCSGLEEEFKYECFAGVFMENLYRINLTQHDISNQFDWNEKELDKQIDYCSSFDGLISRACFRELSHMFVSLNKVDSCKRADNKDSTKTCLDHAASITALTSENSDAGL